MSLSGSTLSQRHTPEGHGAKAGARRRAHEPGFSMLRTSLASRLVIVAGCCMVLWGAVWLVLS